MIDIESIDKEERYDIPEGYFEQLPTVVINRIHKEKAKKRNIWITSVAAVAAVLLCSTAIISYYQRDDVASQRQMALEEQGATNNLEQQMVDYYSSEMAQLDYLNY